MTLRRWEGILSILKCLTSWIKFSIAGTQGRQGKNQRETERAGDLSDTAADLLTSTSRGGHRPSEGGEGSSAKGSSVTGGHHVTGLNALSSCQTLHLVKQPMKQKQSESREVWKDRIVLFCTYRKWGLIQWDGQCQRERELHDKDRLQCWFSFRTCAVFTSSSEPI